MVNPHQQESDHPAVPDRNHITLRLSFIPGLAAQITDALDFAFDVLNFYPSERFIFHESYSSEPITIKDAHGTLMTLNLNPIENDPGIKHIIFHTDDCLRDYHKYIMAGVEFVSRPEYTDAGLQVDFLGNSNNRYTLLEERIYTES